MPLPTTFAGDSARGEGLFASTISLGAGYWAAMLKSAGVYTPQSEALGIVTDSLGNVYICGYGANSADYTTASVSKWNSSGTLQWQRTLTDANATPGTYGNGIAIDSSGNLYIAGRGNDSAGKARILVYKLDNSGTIQWQRTLASPASTPSNVANCISLDSSNNIYVGGYSDENLGPNNTNVIFKFDSSGTLLWKKYLNDGVNPKIHFGGFFGINVDPINTLNIATTGNFTDSSSAGIFAICKYDYLGNLSWQKTIASPTSPAGGLGIAIDGSGNNYVAGYGTTSSSRVIFISKWNSSGTLQWQRTLTDANANPNGTAYGVSIDSTGYIYICGKGYNTAGNNVMSVSKWDSSGTIQFQRTITDNNSSPYSTANSITVDNLGNMYVSGQITSSGGQLYSFISKLPADGSRTGTYSNSSFGFTYAASSWTVATSTWGVISSSYAAGNASDTSSTSTWTAATSTWASSTISI